MKTFNELWAFIKQRPGVMTVQNREELEYVFNLMRDCDCGSYLEVGSAEGNSLYVLSHAVRDKGIIQYVDYGEPHTEQPRRRVVNEIKESKYEVYECLGDSTKPQTHPYKRKVDVVLIDGGHDYTTVISDSIMYAPLATRYVFFHDVQLPEVKAAVDWFVKRWDLGEYSEFINSDSFGYGIIKVKQ